MNLADTTTNIATHAINAVVEPETKKVASNQKPFSCLPAVIIQQAFSYLKLTELGDCRLLSKQCRSLVTDEAFLARTYAQQAFGKRKWAIYYGDVGEEPFLPKNIHTIMQAACPIWNGKKVVQTHMLLLVPKNIDEKPVTLKSLGELVRAPKRGNPTRFSYIQGEVYRALADQPVDKTHWVLMTKDTVPGCGHSEAEENASIANCSQKAQVEYVLPKVLEVSMGIFMKYVSTGEDLYKDHPWTRCEEIIPYKIRSDSEETVACSLSVGGFEIGQYHGLKVNRYLNSGTWGVVVLRKL